MVLRKRLSALIIASVMVLSVSVNAFADGLPVAEYIGEETIAEISDIQESVGLLSLPVDSTNRIVYISKSLYYGSDVYTSGVNPGSYNLTLFNANYPGRYRLGYHNATQGNIRGYVKVNSGTYIDVSAGVSYSAEQYDTLTVGGNVSMYLYTTDVNSGKAIPTTVQLLVNGNPVGDVFQHGTSGATMDVDYKITEDINQLGYRFTYSSAINSYTTNTSYPSIISLFMQLQDDGVFEVSEPPQEDPNTGFLQSILQWIIGIYNSVFVPDSQKDDADAFQSEVSGTVTEADNVKTELDELEKPEPEEIDTDLSGIISDETYTQQTQIFVDLLKFEKITNMLMIVFTMALISYVLFGKKG